MTQISRRDGAVAAYRLMLPFAPASAGVARRRLQAWLDSQGYTGVLADDCRLVVTELIGNAVIHAKPLADGTVCVQWYDDAGEVDIAVTDGGSGSEPVRLDVAPTAPSGRGLALVEALSERWWVEDAVSGTTVHALVSA